MQVKLSMSCIRANNKNHVVLWKGRWKARCPLKLLQAHTQHDLRFKSRCCRTDAPRLMLKWDRRTWIVHWLNTESPHPLCAIRVGCERSMTCLFSISRSGSWPVMGSCTLLAPSTPSNRSSATSVQEWCRWRRVLETASSPVEPMEPWRWGSSPTATTSPAAWLTSCNAASEGPWKGLKGRRKKKKRVENSLCNTL